MASKARLSGPVMAFARAPSLLVDAKHSLQSRAGNHQSSGRQAGTPDLGQHPMPAGSP